MQKFGASGVCRGVVMSRDSDERDGKTFYSLKVGTEVGVAAFEFSLDQAQYEACPAVSQEVEVRFHLYQRSDVRHSKRTGNDYVASSIAGGKVFKVSALVPGQDAGGDEGGSPLRRRG